MNQHASLFAGEFSPGPNVYIIREENFKKTGANMTYRPFESESKVLGSFPETCSTILCNSNSNVVLR